MNIVLFSEIGEGLIDSRHNVCYFHSGCGNKIADAVVLDINTIFDFEEKKNEVCKEKFVSIAILDEEDDYDAFKNFGIDTWIKREDIGEINGLLNLIEKRFLS